MSAIFHCKFDPNFTELHILILNMLNMAEKNDVLDDKEYTLWW